MAPYYEDVTSGITIYHGDARDVLPSLPDESVGLVLTDPPYPAEFLTLFGVLGEQSARLLWTGGSLVTLCGNHQMPEVLALLAPHLRYWWIAGMAHTSKVRMPGKWVTNAWKPALWFVKERRLLDDTRCPLDMIHNLRQDKAFHEWGQPSEWFAKWLLDLATPECPVLDPFMGGGACLFAAKQYGRRAIGIEIEERYCEIAAKRLSQSVMFGAEVA